jgi:hypothetical protein
MGVGQCPRLWRIFGHSIRRMHINVLIFGTYQKNVFPLYGHSCPQIFVTQESTSFKHSGLSHDKHQCPKSFINTLIKFFLPMYVIWRLVMYDFDAYSLLILITDYIATKYSAYSITNWTPYHHSQLTPPHDQAHCPNPQSPLAPLAHTSS